MLFGQFNENRYICNVKELNHYNLKNMSGYHSLRAIKKDIEYVLGAFVEDCSVVACSNAKVAEGRVEELMEEAFSLFDELRDKVKGPVEGSKKAYYNELRKEVLTRTDALYEKLSAAVKEAVK